VTASEHTRRRNPFGLIAVLVGCLLMAAMWGFYFFAASEDGVYQLDDPSWRAAAEPICAAAQEQRLGLVDTSGGFIEEPTIEQMVQRADIVDRATDIVEGMLDAIVAIPVATDRDRAVLEVFEENYRLVIADRRRYTSQLRAGDASRYTETVVAGGPVTNVVSDFTAGVKGNNVPACSPPRELANIREP
jgi:hypothetical protein